MDNWQQQVENGFRISAYFLFGLLTFFLFVDGITTIATPDRVPANSPILRAVFLGDHPIIAGWIFLTVSTVILLQTMDTWVKAVPGVLIYGLLHLPYVEAASKHKGVPVPPGLMIFFVTFCIVAIVASLRLSISMRKLRVMDRAALMGFLVCIALSFTPNNSTAIIALNCSLGFLLFPWAIDFFFNRESDKWPPLTN